MDSYFISKAANYNRLAQQSLYLYETKILSDMIIEMHDDDTKEVNLIQIHSPIIASRCMWFQRALSSGMQEAINKLDLINIFILYVYALESMILSLH